MSACGAPRPGSWIHVCERDEGHDGEHQSTLSPGRTFNYWNGDVYPVGCRVGVIAEVARDEAAARVGIEQEDSNQPGGAK